ncbi:MAG TPA: SufD family Fe-S cluster assembly protein [Thermoplasmata archaeon]|jgi:Fe-S cluster assembly scaffold protein SufB
MASAVPRFEEWLSSEQVGQLSSEFGDPEEFARRRVGAYDRFRHLEIEPNPLYRGYGYFTNVDLAGIEPGAKGPAVGLPPQLEGSIRIVHDLFGTRIELPEDLRKAGVRAIPLSEIWGSGKTEVEAFLRGTEEPADRLSALATALLNRGYRLEIPDHFPQPVRVQELCLLSRPKEALSVRRAIRVGAGAQLLATEEVYSTESPADGQRLYASSTDLDLADYAKTVFLTVHAPDLRTVSVYRRTATTGTESRIGWMWNGLGGYRMKMRNHTRLTGRGSVAEDFQTFYGAKDQSYDSSFDLTHIATDTHGTSVTRGVFTDQARGMSRGLVRIEPDARKTVALISEHAMLLSRGARSDTIPILEILCRDVKATHSTSVAPVDPEKVFYLESRGISESDAVRMIGEGFLANVYDRAPVAGLREILYPSLQARWDGAAILWKAGEYPALPRLDVTGTDAAPDWRFDSKLR